jgi:hypothetical protein
MTDQELIDLMATWRDTLHAEQAARTGARAARVGDFAEVVRNYAWRIAEAAEEAGAPVSLIAFDPPAEEPAP